MNIRPAKKEEYKVIAQLCQTAEGAPNGNIPFQKIFSLSEEETNKLFEALARYDEENIPYSFSSYYFLENSEGEILGGCSAWIEEDFPTEKIILHILADLLGMEKIRQAEENIRIASELSMSRTPNSLQLECIALFPKFRGKGYGQKLLSKVISLFLQEVPSLEKSEIIVMQNNSSALKAYEKLGFTITEILAGKSEELLRIYGDKTKVKLSKTL